MALLNSPYFTSCEFIFLGCFELYYRSRYRHQAREFIREKCKKRGLPGIYFWPKTPLHLSTYVQVEILHAYDRVLCCVVNKNVAGVANPSHFESFLEMNYQSSHTTD